ncbi:beta-2-microglobulin-like [Carassius carassius]|uniref:beta-2-microglobulin-like n=1 Tax=Carassius carassius TaxID=217509 RepID=UPI0028690347|nr:beta-2-microglobulin-like [Carassius carassius]
MANKRENILFIKVVLIIFHRFLSDAQQGSPKIRVFAMKALDDQHKPVLTCLATGFYPRDIELNIRCNQTVLKAQTFTEIRPNDDGSFQMSASVEIERNLRGSYDCLVNHSSLTEPVLAKWDGTYSDSETESQWPVFVGVVAVVVAGLGLLSWLCIKFQKAIIQNFIASLTSPCNPPDPEQAASNVFKYDCGDAMLS